MTGVGFEPTSTNTSELESDPLDHSGNQSGWAKARKVCHILCFYFFKLFANSLFVCFVCFLSFL